MDINPIELASELAHNRTFYESQDICANEDDMYINKDPNTLIYTEEIQDRFNEWYSYYLGQIEKCDNNK